MDYGRRSVICNRCHVTGNYLPPHTFKPREYVSVPTSFNIEIMTGYMGITKTENIRNRHKEDWNANDERSLRGRNHHRE